MNEIKLKYYNSVLNVGFNNWREIYDCNLKIWIKATEHAGRIVYGNKRLPYNLIKQGIDKRDVVVQEECPF